MLFLCAVFYLLWGCFVFSGPGIMKIDDIIIIRKKRRTALLARAKLCLRGLMVLWYYMKVYEV